MENGGYEGYGIIYDKNEMEYIMWSNGIGEGMWIEVLPGNMGKRKDTRM